MRRLLATIGLLILTSPTRSPAPFPDAYPSARQSLTAPLISGAAPAQISAMLLEQTPPHREAPSFPPPRGFAYWQNRIFQCEGGSWTADNPRSTASGGFGILDSTFAGHGGFARAKDAPPHVQIEKAALLFASWHARTGVGLTPWLADPGARRCIL